MKLPFVDDVREARAAAVEAQRAFQDAARVDAAVRALALVEADGRTPDGPLPGEAELRELGGVWPALAALSEAPPPGPLRLAAQRARLEAAQAWLAPRGAAMHARFDVLAAILRQQREALAAPRFRRSMAAVQRRLEAQDGIERALHPMESELVRLEILSRFLEEWSERLATATPTEAGPMRDALRESLEPMLDGVAPAVAGPAAAPLPDPRDWGPLRDRVEARRRSLGAEAARLRAERGRLQGWLAERVG